MFNTTFKGPYENNDPSEQELRMTVWDFTVAGFHEKSRGQKC